jgi:hypothetical protein
MTQPKTPQNTGHRFVSDGEECPRCIYCDCRYGGRHHDAPCER